MPKRARSQRSSAAWQPNYWGDAFLYESYLQSIKREKELFHCDRNVSRRLPSTVTQESSANNCAGIQIGMMMDKTSFDPPFKSSTVDEVPSTEGERRVFPLGGDASEASTSSSHYRSTISSRIEWEVAKLSERELSTKRHDMVSVDSAEVSQHLAPSKTDLSEESSAASNTQPSTNYRWTIDEEAKARSNVKEVPSSKDIEHTYRMKADMSETSSSSSSSSHHPTLAMPLKLQQEILTRRKSSTTPSSSNSGSVNSSTTSSSSSSSLSSPTPSRSKWEVMDRIRSNVSSHFHNDPVPISVDPRARHQSPKSSDATLPNKLSFTLQSSCAADDSMTARSLTLGGENVVTSVSEEKKLNSMVDWSETSLPSLTHRSSIHSRIERIGTLPSAQLPVGKKQETEGWNNRQMQDKIHSSGYRTKECPRPRVPEDAVVYCVDSDSDQDSISSNSIICPSNSSASIEFVKTFHSKTAVENRLSDQDEDDSVEFIGTVIK